MNTQRILVIRLSSMGDVIHTLPAVGALKRNFPESRVSWLIRPHWAPLLEGNPFVDEVIPVRRSIRESLKTARNLRGEKIDLAVDFQGLIQSAMLGKAAGPKHFYGFARDCVRERPAAWFYSKGIYAPAAHVVDRNLELAQGAGALTPSYEFPLPMGTPEGVLPTGKFVLACPLAGWRSKQWPVESWFKLVQMLDLPLVVNGPLSSETLLKNIRGAHVHLSGIAGLIDATRRAEAVIGVDSGPLHLAAALFKTGVALFGPTDPARNGPYGGPIRVIRVAGAATDYRRHAEPAASMRAIQPEMVRDALREILRGKSASCPA